MFGAWYGGNVGSIMIVTGVWWGGVGAGRVWMFFKNGLENWEKICICHSVQGVPPPQFFLLNIVPVHYCSYYPLSLSAKVKQTYLFWKIFTLKYSWLFLLFFWFFLFWLDNQYFAPQWSVKIFHFLCVACFGSLVKFSRQKSLSII